MRNDDDECVVGAVRLIIIRVHSFVTRRVEQQLEQAGAAILTENERKSFECHKFICLEEAM